MNSDVLIFLSGAFSLPCVVGLIILIKKYRTFKQGVHKGRIMDLLPYDDG